MQEHDVVSGIDLQVSPVARCCPGLRSIIQEGDPDAEQKGLLIRQVTEESGDAGSCASNAGEKGTRAE
jgi:hypothetical protein